MRLHITNEIFPVRPNKNSSEVQKLRTNHLSFPINTKVHFKIRTNVFPSRELRRQRFKWPGQPKNRFKVKRWMSSQAFHGTVDLVLVLFMTNKQA